jgi:hypothetical protein
LQLKFRRGGLRGAGAHHCQEKKSYHSQQVHQFGCYGLFGLSVNPTERKPTDQVLDI